MTRPIYVLIFLAALLAVEAVYFLYRDFKQQRAEQFRSRIVQPVAGPIDRVSLLRRRKRRLLSFAALTTWLPTLPLLARLPRFMEAAGVHIELDQFLAYSVASGLIIGLSTSVMAGAWQAGMIGLLAGICLPIVLIALKHRRRQRRIQHQFPEVLDMVVRSLRVGYALTGTFKTVADEFPEPLGPEFRRVYDEHNLGIPLRDALEAMERRLGNLDVRFFVTSVNIQRDTGGNLTEILENLARTIRNRVRLQDEVSAKTAEGRMAGWVLSAIPPVVVGMLAWVNPDYVAVLLNDPRGQTMLKVAIGLILTGMFFIRKIVTIRV